MRKIQRTAVRVAALMALVVASTAPTTAQNLDALITSRDVEGLRERGPAVMSELASVYADTHDLDRRADIAGLFYALGWISPEAERVLFEDVHTDHRDLRINAQYALGRVSNDDRVVDVLFENMRSDHRWLFRDKAACSLAYDQIHLSDRQKVRLYLRLIDALGDPDAGTRALAIQVLVVQTGQDKGYDPNASVAARQVATQRWWQWLAEYRAHAQSGSTQSGSTESG